MDIQKSWNANSRHDAWDISQDERQPKRRALSHSVPFDIPLIINGTGPEEEMLGLGDCDLVRCIHSAKGGGS